MTEHSDKHWKFPTTEFVILRVELLFVGIISLLLLAFSYYTLEEQWFPAIMFTIGFMAMYIIVSAIVQKIRSIEEHYHIKSDHIEIIRKSRTGTKKEKVHFKDIKHHKLDKTFLGGYLVTHKNKKHVLFFNTKKEIEHFEDFIKKHLKKNKK